MVKQVKRDQRGLVSRCMSEGHLYSNVPQKRAIFSLKTLWYVFLRHVHYTYLSNWVLVMAQFVTTVGIGALMPLFFDWHIGEPDGCIQLDQHDHFNFTDINQKDYRELIREEMKLDQSMKMIFFSQITLDVLTLIWTVLLFSKEIKVFHNEHANSK